MNSALPGSNSMLWALPSWPVGNVSQCFFPALPPAAETPGLPAAGHGFWDIIYPPLTVRTEALVCHRTDVL